MRILLVKTSSAGDIVQAYPVLEYLKTRHPSATVDWVCEERHRELLERHPLLDHLLLIDTHNWKRGKRWGQLYSFLRQLRKEKYDLLLDLQGNIKSGLVTACVKAKVKIGFGFKSVSEWPNVLFTNFRVNPEQGQNIRDDYLALAKAFFEDSDPFEEKGILLKLLPEEAKILDKLSNKSGTPIMVCPGANWLNKQATDEALVAFIKNIKRERPDVHFLWIWGNAKEKERAEKLSALCSVDSRVVEKLTLPLLQNLMKSMSLVIAMDSLPLHLAAAAAVPTFGIFGPSSAKKYGPRGKGHKALQGTCDLGCTFEKRCPRLRSCGHGKCMKNMNGELFLKTLKEK